MLCVEFEEFKDALVTSIFNIIQSSLKGDLNICSENLIKGIKCYNKSFQLRAPKES